MSQYKGAWGEWLDHPFCQRWMKKASAMRPYPLRKGMDMGVTRSLSTMTADYPRHLAGHGDAEPRSYVGRSELSAFPHHPPNRIRQVIRHDQRAARVDRYAHRAASGLAVFIAKAGDEVDGVA